jgi:hypothetical protein
VDVVERQLQIAEELSATKLKIFSKLIHVGMVDQS